eukprot:4732817-Pyramimonas_sp.AAC.1
MSHCCKPHEGRCHVNVEPDAQLADLALATRAPRWLCSTRRGQSAGAAEGAPPAGRGGKGEPGACR